MGERQSWWYIGYAGWKFCHPTYSGSPKRKHCPWLCFRTVIFMLCEIHILTKARLSCTVLCVPKRDHAKGNKLWCQSKQLCALQWLVSPKDGSVYQVAQALAKSPWMQSSHPPASYTSISTMFIAKKLCASTGQSSECEKDCPTAPFMGGSGPGKWLIEMEWFSWHPW